MKAKKGVIIAVCTSEKAGVPKHPQEAAVIAEFGILGDYHCKPTRQSFSKPGTEKPNDDRHVTIVAEESLDCANKALGLSLKPGDLGENITVRGMGDLSDIPDGALIRINRSIVLQVSGQNNPCIVLRPYHPEIGRVLFGKRGLLCAVKEGVGNSVQPGQEVEIGQNE